MTAVDIGGGAGLVEALDDVVIGASVSTSA
jgi:hypothetical protein